MEPVSETMEPQATHIDNELDFWKAWPEYTSLFQDHPERAAAMARELAIDDLRYLPFILSFPWKEDISQIHEALTSDFLVALLDIATTEFWYTQWRQAAGPERIAKECWCSILLVLTLRCICKLILVQGRIICQPTSIDVARQCIQRFPALWKLFWEDRDIIFTDTFVDDAPGDTIISVVLYLLQCHFFLVEHFEQDVPPVSSYAAHVCFVVWLRKDQPRVQGLMAARIAVGILEESPNKRDDVEDVEFVRNVVPAVVGQQDPLELFLNVLTVEEEDMLEPRNLYNILDMASMVLFGCQPPPPISEDTRKKMLYTLARIYYRCQCSGDMDDATSMPVKLSKAIMNCFKFVYKYCGIEDITQDILSDLYHLHFIPILAKALVFAFIPYSSYETDRELRDSCLIIVVVLQNYGERARLDSPDRVPWDYTYLRRILQVHWLPVLKDLQTVLRASQEDNRPSSDLQVIMEKWQELGTVYYLSDKSRECDSLEAFISYVTPAERRKGCFLTECLCYGHKSPWHQTRRVCKGCWSAFYCSKQCQKKDWKLGHKNVCVGRQSSR